ncbi:MAG: hypothetical protein HQM09_10685 [Candidatus Riflebacteria bacterium]|nr:hypothetical protein [Candidatus Riflebacteria bacterium]
MRCQACGQTSCEAFSERAIEKSAERSQQR